MSYAKGKPMDNMSLFEFHPDNVPEMIIAQEPTSHPIAMIFKMMAEGDITMNNIENNFEYHAPNDDQRDRYVIIREHAKDFAFLIEEFCPESREKSLAMTKLEECVMWANAAIARNE